MRAYPGSAKSTKFVVLFLATLVRLSGQSDPGWPDTAMPSRGLIPTGAYAVSDIETINVVNGNAIYRIPSRRSHPAGLAGQPGSISFTTPKYTT